MQGEALPSNGLKDGLVQRLEVHGAGEFLRPPFLPRLRTIVQVLQTDIVPKATDNIETQCFSSGNKGLLGKEGIRNKAIGQLKKVILERVYGPQGTAHGARYRQKDCIGPRVCIAHIRI